MTARWSDPHRPGSPSGRLDDGLELVAAFLAGVRMAGALDVAVPDYDIRPGILLTLLGAILALLGLEASALWRGVR